LTRILGHPCEFQVLVEGWRSAVDPSSGKTYYIETATRRTTWDKPAQQMGTCA
jgi:hypothetical protein